MRYQTQSDDDDDDEVVLDMSIVGDDEEQHRIELEQNLQDLSIQLSLSTPSDQEYGTEGNNRQQRHSQSSSFELEYPRHAPRSRDFSVFHGQNSSFLDNTQMEPDFNPNYYPYQSIHDDDDVHCVGNTMSTPAHHVSAVTLSAGLAGRGGKRAFASEASLSGAEYDPDRPLDSVLNGVAEDLSMLNMDNTMTRGKRGTRDTYFVPTQVNFDPVIVDHDTSAINNRLARTSNNKHTHEQAASSHPGRASTPKAKTRTKRPDVTIHPPTPSAGANATSGSTATNGSKFTRLAKTLAKEIEASQRWATVPNFEDSPQIKPTRKKQSRHRSPFRDVINRSLPVIAPQLPQKAKRRSSRPATTAVDTTFDDLARHEQSQAKTICLPDVTGLTSVIGSPPRKKQEWHRYSGEGVGEHIEVELLKTLTTLQTRLNQLESQNLVSRRRIRELEIELETCKLEIKRERTRVLEREEIIVAQQMDFEKRRKAFAKPVKAAPDPANESRYNEVVEEKKALESLIATLRSHLSRLTTELSNQQSQLDELRSLRDHDLQDLRDKISEVDSLKLEIDRLGSEVEILRGVVEEGLNERRKAKETLHSFDISGGSEGQNSVVEGPSRPGRNDIVNEPSGNDLPALPPSRPRSRQKHSSKAPSTALPSAGPSRLSIASKENVAEDPIRSKPEGRSDNHRARNSGISQFQANLERGDRQDIRRTRVARFEMSEDNRPSTRKPGEGSPPKPQLPVNELSRTETPFPRIRGEHLERLFFSAPEHNEKTCRVCHRHRRPGASDDELDFPSWLPPRKRTKISKEEEVRSNEGTRVRNKAPFSEDRLPPQTVLARVLSELEDDFAHYKGIYIELAEQYKIIDAASNVAKRNVLAEHLKEVIDTLEQKGDQIASLYDLLVFKDKPVTDSIVPERKHVPLSPRARQSGSRHSRGLRKYATYS